MTKSVQDFTFGFDGEALREHKIDAIYLSIALAGLDNLLMSANSILNENNSQLKIKIKPNFEAGSIQILTELQQYAGMFPSLSLEHILEMLGLTAITKETIINGSKIVEGGAKAVSSLIDLYRKLTGKRIDKQEDKKDTIVLHLSDRTKLEVKTDIVKLFSNNNVRKAVSVLLSPLEQDGIDEFYTLDNKKQKSQSIKKDEIETFVYREEETDNRITNIIEEERTLFIKKVDFIKKSPWEFISDGRVIKAQIEDEEFIDKVKNGLHLYAGCYFRCKMIVSYELNEDNIPIDGKTKYTITKIFTDTIEPVKQQQLL